MKAFLLAAGEGTRLSPLTVHIPKCLVPIAGKPLLEIWFDLLLRYGISEVLINTHHLAGQVEDFIRFLKTPIKTHLTYEPELLGSAGTLLQNRDFVKNEPFFWIIYTDSLTDANLGRLMRFHKKADSLLTLGLFHVDNPTQSGIVLLDCENRIVNFIEKPANPSSDLANTGIMIASPSLLDEIQCCNPCDLSLNVLPNFVGRMYGKLIEGFFIDIGTPERYNKALTKYKQLSQITVGDSNAHVVL